MHKLIAFLMLVVMLSACSVPGEFANLVVAREFARKCTEQGGILQQNATFLRCIETKTQEK